jgi:hypothetical protein
VGLCRVHPELPPSAPPGPHAGIGLSDAAEKLPGPGGQKRGSSVLQILLQRDNTSAMRTSYSHLGRIFKVTAWMRNT